MTQSESVDGRRWTPRDIGDLTGRTVLITGANSGLGLASARALASHGATVLMAGRDPGRLAAAAATIVGAPPIRVELDLANLDSVRAAARQVAGSIERLDVLMNNAGVMAPPLRRTEDGFESQIGTNHLGHFALTGFLLPLLRHPGARVVTVSSLAHGAGRIDLGDLNYEHRSYSPWPAYSQSKLANLLFTAELARLALRAGWDLVAAAAHPGYASTNLQFAGPSIAHGRIGRTVFSLANGVFGQSAEAGAWPQLYASVGPDVHPNDYFGPRGLRETRGHPRRVGRSRAAQDMASAARLWDLSEQQTGVGFTWT